MAAPPSGSTCACPITKTVTVNFTGSIPAPSNGYIVGYRTAGSSSAYTYVSPNPTSSPVNISNVPVCEDLEVVVQSQCDNSQVSSPQTTTVTGYTSYVCGDIIDVSHSHLGFYAYPSYLLDVRGASDLVTLEVNCDTIPNRFTVYDANNNIVVSSASISGNKSGWIGTAAYSGPWGASISTVNSGFLTFSKNGQCFYRLYVESQTGTNTQDHFTVNITCPVTGDVPVPTITYQSCSSGYGSYRIDAPSGTSLKIKLTASGSLTNNSVNGYCARLEGSLVSSTGPSDSEVSSVVTTTGSASIGGSNSLFVDVTVPGTGYLIINTSVFTVNSTASLTSATLSIIEVNGSAANITQSVCVQNSTGVVSCGSPTYTNYLATRFICGSCVQDGADDAFIVAFANTVSVVQGKFYVPDGGSGQVGSYVYLVGAQTSTGPGLIMQNLSATTCAGACSLNIKKVSGFVGFL
jgi:hypothetical protein